MKYSKKTLIEKAMTHPDVAKTIEAIVRTHRDSRPRELAVVAFECMFEKVTSELMIENIGYDLGENIEVKGKLFSATWFKLMHTTGFGSKLLTILCNDDNFGITIAGGNDIYISLHNFTVEDDVICLSMKVRYTKDEEINKRTDEIIKILRLR